VKGVAKIMVNFPCSANHPGIKKQKKGNPCNHLEIFQGNFSQLCKLFTIFQLYGQGTYFKVIFKNIITQNLVLKVTLK
jgi:hypothetical protein